MSFPSLLIYSPHFLSQWLFIWHIFPMCGSAKLLAKGPQNRTLKTTPFRIMQISSNSLTDVPLNTKFVPGYINTCETSFEMRLQISSKVEIFKTGCPLRLEKPEKLENEHFFKIWLEKLENHRVFSSFGWKSFNFFYV